MGISMVTKGLFSDLKEIPDQKSLSEWVTAQIAFFSFSGIKIPRISQSWCKFPTK